MSNYKGAPMIKLRSFRWKDAEFVKSVLFNVQEQYLNVLPGYIEGLTRYIDNKDLEPFGRIRMIEIQGIKVGWISEIDIDELNLYVGHYYLLPTYHQKGIGSEVLKYYLSTLKSMGKKSVTVDAHLSMDDVVRFYKKNGFVEVVLDHDSTHIKTYDKHFIKLKCHL